MTTAPQEQMLPVRGPHFWRAAIETVVSAGGLDRRHQRIGDLVGRSDPVDNQ